MGVTERDFECIMQQIGLVVCPVVRPECSLHDAAVAWLPLVMQMNRVSFVAHSFQAGYPSYTFPSSLCIKGAVPSSVIITQRKTLSYSLYPW